MPKKTPAKKPATKKTEIAVHTAIWNGCKEFGRGVLKFFEMLFLFIIKVLKLLPDFLKALAWIVLAVGLVSAIFTAIAIHFLSVLGLDESQEWQLYRENLLNHVFEEMAEETEHIEIGN